ncbi:hypothetical protein ACOCG7_30830 [Paraburkholderia sp. DD10]|uniref:hypothetical protein n=1 Tax=Paraburkholderia sp. DD10 TaxID=3409691 RepID=UPI003BA2FE61
MTGKTEDLAADPSVLSAASRTELSFERHGWRKAERLFLVALSLPPASDQLLT